MSLTASMMQKRQALAELVKTTLDAHGFATFIVDQRVRRALLDATGEVDRKAIMGATIAYARVAHVGDVAREGDASPWADVNQVAHQFAVFVWYEFEDAQNYADSSQAEWDALMEGPSTGEDPPGLLVALRETGAFESGDHVVYLGRPEAVMAPDEPFHMGERIFAHYVQFFVTIQ